jgi:hypothetical protein
MTDREHCDSPSLGGEVSKVEIPLAGRRTTEDGVKGFRTDGA